MKCPFCEEQLVKGYISLTGDIKAGLIFCKEMPTGKFFINTPHENILKARWKMKDNFVDGYMCNNCQSVHFKKKLK